MKTSRRLFLSTVRATTLTVLLVLTPGVLVVAAPAFGQVLQPGGSLQSTAWRWVHSVLDEDTFVAPVDRDRYTVTFGPGGIVSVRADCNQVSGTCEHSPSSGARAR